MASLSKFQSECQKKNILRNLFPEKKNKENLVFRIWAKKFRISAGRISPICQKCNLRVQGNNLRKNNNFEIKYVPLGRFWTSRQLFLELWQKKVSTVVQTAFYKSRRRVWKKNVFFLRKIKLFVHPRNFSKKVGFWQTNSTSSSNPHSRCPEERTEEKTIFLKRNFYWITFGNWP